MQGELRTRAAGGQGNRVRRQTGDARRERPAGRQGRVHAAAADVLAEQVERAGEGEPGPGKRDPGLGDPDGRGILPQREERGARGRLGGEGAIETRGGYLHASGQVDGAGPTWKREAGTQGQSGACGVVDGRERDGRSPE